MNFSSSVKKKNALAELKVTILSPYENTVVMGFLIKIVTLFYNYF